MINHIRSLTGRFTGRSWGPGAMVVALLALVVSAAGVAEAVSYKGPSAKPRPYGVLVLNKKKKFPASAIPTVRNSARLGGSPRSALIENCAADSVDMGTLCIMSSPWPVEQADEGKNDYFYATRTCAENGGYLPTAELLVGAADRIKLAGNIDDSATTASIDEDAADGLKDRREMSATLVTTAAGSSAAGTQGVTEGSLGDPKAGEPNPVPLPANPIPETLQYVTVYDNKNNGGFAGSKPVGQAERFRCAFNKIQAREQRKIAE